MAKNTKKVTTVHFEYWRPGLGKTEHRPMSPVKRQEEIESLMKKLKAVVGKFAGIKLADVEKVVVDYENLRADLEVVLEDVSDAEKRARKLLEVEVPYELYDTHDDVKHFQSRLKDVL